MVLVIFWAFGVTTFAFSIYNIVLYTTAFTIWLLPPSKHKLDALMAGEAGFEPANKWKPTSVCATTLLPIPLRTRNTTHQLESVSLLLHHIQDHPQYKTENNLSACLSAFVSLLWLMTTLWNSGFQTLLKLPFQGQLHRWPRCSVSPRSVGFNHTNILKCLYVRVSRLAWWTAFIQRAA
jgi:hypothetical protein